MPGVGDKLELEPVEKAIHLLGDDGQVDDKFLRQLLAHGVKQGGMATRNPVESADRLHTASKDATSLLVDSLSLLSGEKLITPGTNQLSKTLQQ